jgi:bifunctional non-homologous end joining protein LigD
VVWTEPDTVVEIEFATWTTDGRLRHPVVRGLRADKPVEEAQGER